ncbi:hypothetical protein H8S95_01270 [Pontibacter sp. KCTC 32443]|uniref:hypothetical protein n=1 Tax=Pontibacter TaxID=323449 RepID=UPI00164D2C40|nr:MULTISPECIES: hypothetical protein [Pontibacter]MBC5772678.1 hypothetical protein [Pontibacter sp. KCTC 32443]
MERYERDNYYHSGLGSENRRDWDRSSRDGDFGRDYENRYRSTHDRDEEYRRRSYGTDRNYSDNQSNRYTSDDLRRGYGVSRLGGYGSRYDDTDYVARMERDREILQQQGYGSGRTSGYSGSAFGGSNYSSHGGFGGSSGYNNMSGGGGNADDYVSMSGYGGGRGNISVHSDRGVPNYSRSRFGDQYGYEGISAGMGTGSTYGGQNYGGGTGYGSGNQGGSWGRDTYGSSSGNYGGYGSMGGGGFESGTKYKTYSADNYSSGSSGSYSDRGGYSNYDPNNRWNS